MAKLKWPPNLLTNRNRANSSCHHLQIPIQPPCTIVTSCRWARSKWLRVMTPPTQRVPKTGFLLPSVLTTWKKVNSSCHHLQIAIRPPCTLGASCRWARSKWLRMILHVILACPQNRIFLPNVLTKWKKVNSSCHHQQIPIRPLCTLGASCRWAWLKWWRMILAAIHTYLQTSKVPPNITTKGVGTKSNCPHLHLISQPPCTLGGTTCRCARAML